ncbi:response regulator transcription factor [Paraburkholderia saeva]|jgi:two-component system, NarL family, captular synthesis response regulator RcsB|uniref:Transcriptional regulatory protein RcsB n=1 Tax=Paraburkholderia saeva TaxID=2777537 RepID=A0A9N8RUA6_9BURK|nr:response regulator transcription factor [Paraburkholderia saeva]CAG4890980.1 Transcriptional regulatory protein RcsB [Paraburkholderia saeva]CAG4894256.1 Transcriptional regulatory protein RcsB [Paraburkholderia saeva]CAG4924128.1 Transcriptional regulatory protein RcsB [Paraburkholderia saeva]
MPKLRVVVADDHPFVVIGVRAALALHETIEVVGDANGPQSLMRLLETQPCDVLVTDLTMPEGGAPAEDGLRLMRRIREAWPQIRIIVLTSLTNAGILRSIMTDGVSGVINKTGSMEELATAVRTVGCGRSYVSKSILATLAEAGSEAGEMTVVPRLSPRETEVVGLFVSGLSISEIARRLDRNVRTVSRQKRDAMLKLGVSNDPGLFAFVRAHGMA